jgi:hypothetical protein
MTFSAVLFDFHSTCRANLLDQHAPTAPASHTTSRHAQAAQAPFTRASSPAIAAFKKAHQPLHASQADDAPHDILGQRAVDIALLNKTQASSNEVLGAAEAQQVQALSRTPALRCNVNEGRTDAEKRGRAVEA